MGDRGEEGLLDLSREGCFWRGHARPRRGQKGEKRDGDKRGKGAAKHGRDGDERGEKAG